MASDGTGSESVSTQENNWLKKIQKNQPGVQKDFCVPTNVPRRLSKYKWAQEGLGVLL